MDATIQCQNNFAVRASADKQRVQTISKLIWIDTRQPIALLPRPQVKRRDETLDKQIHAQSRVPLAR